MFQGTFLGMFQGMLQLFRGHMALDERDVV